MLIIKNETENWRELAYDLVDRVQAAWGKELPSELDRDDALYDFVAEALRDETLRAYRDMGDGQTFDYEVTHKAQRRGSFVIVQDGTPEERDAFDKAIEATMEANKAYVIGLLETELQSQEENADAE